MGTEYRIEDAHQAFEFTGKLIGQSTTRSDTRPLRWVEMSLYSVDGGGEIGYVLHRTGNSAVYHRADRQRCPVGRGSVDITKLPDVTVASLDDDAMPCAECQPPWPQDLGDDEKVRAEQTRHTVNKLADPAAVISRISEARHADGSTTTFMSRPARELLEQAAEHDPEFRQVPKPVERIG